ncbi:MAG: sugar transferase [Clostridia bacterium]|jgi:exopolysaccharide biosynthesis polyprenyl glycosylphosphotransferase
MEIQFIKPQKYRTNQPYDYQSIAVKDSCVYLVVKRLMDIFISIIGMIVLSPVFMLTALAIKVESKGPVLFRQVRTGKNGKEFVMLKFRSMVMNAEELLTKLKTLNELDGPAFKIKDDPRVTRVGEFIRRTSIEELPQLFNVLVGDMSIVGPRPPIPHEVAEYTPYQMQRLLVKPGITCLWQISGRSNLSFKKWMELDLKSIQERSLWLDIKIMVKTIPVVLKSDGAY